MQGYLLMIHSNPGTWVASHHTRSGCRRKRHPRCSAFIASKPGSSRRPEAAAPAPDDLDDAGCRQLIQSKLVENRTRRPGKRKRPEVSWVPGGLAIAVLQGRPLYGAPLLFCAGWRNFRFTYASYGV